MSKKKRKRKRATAPEFAAEFSDTLVKLLDEDMARTAWRRSSDDLGMPDELKTALASWTEAAYRAGYVTALQQVSRAIASAQPRL